jgi:hypothetical protein
MEYWVIDVESGNGQGCYDSMNEALRAVAAEIRASGGESTDPLAVVAMGGYEGGREIMRGRELAKRALALPTPNRSD